MCEGSLSSVMSPLPGKTILTGIEDKVADLRNTVGKGVIAAPLGIDNHKKLASEWRLRTLVATPVELT